MLTALFTYLGKGWTGGLSPSILPLWEGIGYHFSNLGTVDSPAGLSPAMMDFSLGSFLSRWKMGPVMCPFVVKDAKASTAFGSCRGGSEDPLLVSVGSVLGVLFVEVGLGTCYWSQSVPGG